MKLYLLFAFIAFQLTSCYAQKAIEKWSFDSDQPFYSEVQNFEIKHAIASYKLNIVDGFKGKAIQSATDQNVITTNLFSRNSINGDFTISFYFNGNSFTYTSYPSTVFRISLNYSYLNLLYPIKNSNKTGQIQIPLKGTGITSADYLANGWHHWLFSFKKNGVIQIWIDGQTTAIFNIKAENYGVPPNNISDGFRTSGLLDEIEFFNAILPDAFIIKNYKINLIKPISSSNLIKTSEIVNEELGTFYDKMDFAPGFPNYTIYALQQLKRFPSPRYSDSFKLPRNFPWYDINYLHRVFSSPTQRMGDINPKIAVEITDELVKRWNYYMELPTLRTDSNTALKMYTDSKGIYHALINYANNNPSIPAATITYQLQNKGVHAGYDYSGPFLKSQQLPERNYLQDNSGKVIIYNNKKWLNPFTSDEVFIKDGKVAAFYINQLAKHLKREINIINENGEWFGHTWPEDLLNKSSSVIDFKKKNKLNNHQFNGWMHNHFDSVYKQSLLNNIPWKDVKFTFYNISAYNPDYWPEYSMRINSNSFFNGSPRSTPSFYPARPDNWRLSAGALNGYGTVAEGRRYELELGVKHFAPFVSAGWSLEERNIRPAQWLALLKSMVMLGADFFHVGYFNVTGSGGWPNGKGPNDPRGYVYQIASAGYAQALASRIYPFLTSGILLDPHLKENLRSYAFRFKASQENHLVMARKLNNQYLIYGSIQPNSNLAGNVPDEAATEIELEGEKIKFKISRQGAMYIYIPGTAPKFIQLDGWHQKEHPYYWSENYPLEAENADNLTFNAENIITANYKSNDFSEAVSFVRLNGKQQLIFNINNENEYVEIQIRIKANASAVLKIQNGSQVVTKDISNKGWKTINIPFKLLKSNSTPLVLSLNSGEVEIDYLKFF